MSLVYTRLPQTVEAEAVKGAELIFIDCPAFARAPTEKAIEVAHLVLIPCRTTVQDLQFVETTFDLAAAQGKPTAIVLNAVEPQIREFEESRTYLANQKIGLAPVYLSKAVAYHRAITAALGATEYDPTSKAAQELLSLLEWISRLLGLSNVARDDSSKHRVAGGRH